MNITNETRGAAEACNCENTAHRKQSNTTYRPPVDVFEFGDRFEIRVELPGTRSDAIELTVRDGELELAASVEDRYPGGATPLHREYGVGDYRRCVRLGEDIDTEALSAVYLDGVLSVTLPKQARRQPRRVPVRAG